MLNFFKLLKLSIFIPYVFWFYTAIAIFSSIAFLGKTILKTLQVFIPNEHLLQSFIFTTIAIYLYLLSLKTLPCNPSFR